ncbi:uncharacterized protein LOC113128036 [Mastacembelus armatus]|uniref:uncharacterized protein LOC113128036 n=1 Tax=Mastacembelus armatus TaxID=205130 RepID=UPI000E456948|nr:uncharacterized protein LOC113128036 [Mastacembelus armatus]
MILLIFGFFRKLCEAQVDREEEASKIPDGADGAGGAAFFALRSCHQLLHGNSGEFFSPDYLCSNPSLWCNWTIQVDPGKRIHLHLGDLTPDDVCHLKQDQIHVDEPTGPFGVHGILQTCWQEARYTSSSNTLYVVLLIGGWPSPPYRGFYGRYQAFGPPVAFNPQEGFTGGGRQSTPSAGLMDLNEPGVDTNGGQMESEYPSPVDSALSYDYYNQLSVRSAELPWEAEDSDTEVHENLHVYPVTAAPIVPASTLETFQSGRGVAPTLANQAVSQDHTLKRTTNTLTAIRRHVEDASHHLEEAAVPGAETNTQSWTEPKSEQAGDGENQTEIDEDSDQNPSPSEKPEPEEPHPHPNMVEPLSDHRENPDVRNHSVSPHLPGDHLFEVAVEVNLSQDLEESWDNQVKSLLLSVKTVINHQLEPLHTPLSMSSKRLKRLKAGVLYILWLQTGPAPGGPQVHKTISSILQGLIATSISLRENRGTAVIISVSTEDVNECGTQLVLCDVNADCVNQFGTYSCRCRPGFQDRSRLGSGGTICVDLKAAGCGSGLSAETKGVYVLFFLLSSLFLILVVVAAMMYHRHHRGSFLVRCHSNSSSHSFSPPDLNNNNNQPHHGYSCPGDSHLPPPPVPARGPRGGWTQGKEGSPAIDLRLLRFSLLQPPDGCQEPQESGKT